MVVPAGFHFSGESKSAIKKAVGLPGVQTKQYGVSAFSDVVSPERAMTRKLHQLGVNRINAGGSSEQIFSVTPEFVKKAQNAADFEQWTRRIPPA